MKTNTFKVRGYEGIKHGEFDEKDDLATLLGKDRLLSVVNAYLIAHEWNSNFENALCKKAEEAGHVRTVKKNDKGVIVERETNSAFLKRTEFKLDAKAAQDLADTVAFPPVVQPRGEKVDKDLVERLQLAQALLADASKLERYRRKVEFGNSESETQIAWPDFNGDTSEDEDAQMLAEVIRQERVRID